MATLCSMALLCSFSGMAVSADNGLKIWDDDEGLGSGDGADDTLQ